jgi:hypothetical protein
MDGDVLGQEFLVFIGAFALQDISIVSSHAMFNGVLG